MTGPGVARAFTFALVGRLAYGLVASALAQLAASWPEPSSTPTFEIPLASTGPRAIADECSDHPPSRRLIKHGVRCTALPVRGGCCLQRIGRCCRGMPTGLVLASTSPRKDWREVLGDPLADLPGDGVGLGDRLVLGDGSPRLRRRGGGRVAVGRGGNCARPRPHLGTRSRGSCPSSGASQGMVMNWIPLAPTSLNCRASLIRSVRFMSTVSDFVAASRNLVTLSGLANVSAERTWLTIDPMNACWRLTRPMSEPFPMPCRTRT